ncbi:uncharacterized protein LOC112900350 isoform X2 [Panicum hallii]|uniref:uncharacterized protein LOC112900350 isoform X2 n=1 Tax=Panicum hallii TaxID=206008 RepID=UPI000DF4D159|nr:uncharacterized protein LOC112900350 isoform X2 [Panicum hallii]
MDIPSVKRVWIGITVVICSSPWPNSRLRIIHYLAVTIVAAAVGDLASREASPASAEGEAVRPLLRRPVKLKLAPDPQLPPMVRSSRVRKRKALKMSLSSSSTLMKQ